LGRGEDFLIPWRPYWKTDATPL